ncbi:MAG: DinB family protein [Gemmataceae bacterium]|nr:DinB family protein [Gemmataceae bacterium]MCI0740696.1 DinB family protein [Gemmataceae bacterium]
MQAKEAMALALSDTRNTLSMYFGDLSDADLQVRPVPSANNIAWQMGHLINSEVFLGKDLPGATYPELPAKLKGQYNDEASKGVPKAGYLSKAEYLEWFNNVRKATIENVARLSDADFDKPSTGPMAKFAPTIGALVLLISNHTLMHAGQFTVTRRALNKPVVF